MEQERKRSIVIHGSCVSRDLVAGAEARLRTQSYVARQSWISTYSPASPIPEQQDLQSAFQIRNLEGDWRSSAARTLRAESSRADAVLLDLVDERDGVYEIAPGRYVTNSAELRRSGWLRRGLRPRLVPLGTDEHLELWRAAAERMRRLLDELGLQDRTTLLATPFTDVADDGEVPQHSGVPAAEWNRRYAAYYDVARELGFAVIELPAPLARSTSQHVWGLAPYHYVSEAYTWWEQRLRLA